jgi:hypothetical protein
VAAASPTLADRLAQDGIDLIVAGKGDKVSRAELRTAQHDSVHLGFLADKRQQINTLNRLDEEASYQHRYFLRGSERGTSNSISSGPRCHVVQ